MYTLRICGTQEQAGKTDKSTKTWGGKKWAEIQTKTERGLVPGEERQRKSGAEESQKTKREADWLGRTHGTGQI